MPIVYRSVKGSPLTNAEVDGNFSTLDAGKADVTGELFSGDTGVQRTDANDANVIADAPAGQFAGILIRSGGSNRWRFSKDNSNESGSNAGSNLALRAYDDSGNSLGDVLTINRASQVINTLKRPTFNGLVPYDTGNLPLFSGRNRIINGDCRVNQRAASVNSVASVYVYGAVDRFPLVTGGGATTGVTQSTLGDTDENGTGKQWINQAPNVAVTDFSGSKYWGGILQLIEGNNVLDLRNNPNGISVGFRFKAKLPGRYSVSLHDGGFTCVAVGTINVLAADTSAYYVVNFQGIPSSSTVGSGGTSANALWLRIGFLNNGTAATATTGAAWQVASGIFGASLSVSGMVNWAASTSNYIRATDIQVEEGPATPFERRLYSEQLLMCQRYYQTAAYSIDSRAVTSGIGYTTTISLAVVPRASPTVLQSSVYAVNGFPTTAPTYTVVTPAWIVASKTANATVSAGAFFEAASFNAELI